MIAESLRSAFPSDVAVDLELAAGTVTALLGADGAGTSTMLGLLATVVRPSTGRLEIAGVDGRRRPRKARRHLGYIAPTPFRPGAGAATVHEHLRVHAACQGVPRAQRRSAVDAVIELFDLGVFVGSPLGDLSHGWLRRVQVAASFVHTPDVLLLDEPFAGIDTEAQADHRRLLTELADLGTTIVLATDHLTGLDGICDSVGIVAAGRIVRWGTPEQLVGAMQRGSEVTVRLLDGSQQTYFAASAEDRAALLARLLADGMQVVDFHTEDRGLEVLVVANDRSVPSS